MRVSSAQLHPVNCCSTQQKHPPHPRLLSSRPPPLATSSAVHLRAKGHFFGRDSLVLQHTSPPCSLTCIQRPVLTPVQSLYRRDLSAAVRGLAAVVRLVLLEQRGGVHLADSLLAPTSGFFLGPPHCPPHWLPLPPHTLLAVPRAGRLS